MVVQWREVGSVGHHRLVSGEHQSKTLCVLPHWQYLWWVNQQLTSFLPHVRFKILIIKYPKLHLDIFLIRLGRKWLRRKCARFCCKGPYLDLHVLILPFLWLTRMLLISCVSFCHKGPYSKLQVLIIFNFHVRPQKASINCLTCYI